jgi:uncharacterized repeat protein (TIGR03803 family)
MTTLIASRTRISWARLQAVGCALASTLMLAALIIATAAAQAQTYTVLYSFTGGADGANPEAGLIRDAAGNLYGTTQYGGNTVGPCGSFGCGVVFKLDNKNNETVLHRFTAGTDGENPEAGLVRDADGNLYGTAFFGGDMARCGGSGCGVLFKLDPTGKRTVLHTFTGGADGAHPLGDLILDGTGNLYGTTSLGGMTSGRATNDGVVFKIDKSGNETVLYTFPAGGAEGASPHAGVIPDAAGNWYGTTILGGTAGCIGGGCGTVFKLDRNNKETVLHSFRETDGKGPDAPLIRDAAGNLYGTTGVGGAYDAGTVFILDKTGKETVLYTFTGGVDGLIPTQGVVRDAAGNLYGTTCCGGTFNWGTVYKVDKTGNETVLYNFTGGTDGASPFGGVILDADGNLYGTTAGGGTSIYGVVFKLVP